MQKYIIMTLSLQSKVFFYHPGGIFFAKQMRQTDHVTFLDVFTVHGQVLTGFLFIVALLSELFWSAAILSALGELLCYIINPHLLLLN